MVLVEDRGGFSEQLFESVFCNLPKVELVVYFGHIQSPSFHHSFPFPLHLLFLVEPLQELVHEAGDVPVEGVTGFERLVEPIDDQVDKGGVGGGSK